MDIYQYEDYKALLKELFEAKKADDPSYSFRIFAKNAGISNPGFLNDVIKGRRKLSKDARLKMARGFGLNANETEYFCLLVDFGLAKNAVERDELYQQILFRRSRSSFARIHPEQAKYYQDYRYPLIRSAIEVVDFRGNYEALSRYMRPAIPVNVVQKIVRDLCEWNLVQQGRDGRYQVTSKMVEPAPNLKEQVRQLNRTWIKQAEEALLEIPPTERHISTILMNINAEQHQLIESKIQTLRQEIFDMVEQESNPDHTMQLSLAWFPRSQNSLKNGNKKEGK